MGPRSERHQHLVLEQIQYDPVQWGAVIDGRVDAEVFHSPEWLGYLADSQGAEPVIARVLDAGQNVGYFVGAIVHRYGMRILGSPLRGWTTAYMGFLLDEGVDRRAAAEALRSFAFAGLGALHLQLVDRALTAGDMVGSSYVLEDGAVYRASLEGSEEDMLARFNATTRNLVRRATRDGLRCEFATDEGFADDFYAQTSDVFMHQNLVPTYGMERVRSLIRNVQPSGQLLMLRVRDQSDKCIATCLSVGRNSNAVLWGAAFFRDHAKVYPNEVMHWETMRRWRERGAICYDMGGGGEYKRKYGAKLEPWLSSHQSRFRILDAGRSGVRIAFGVRQSLAGRRANRTSPATSTAAEMCANHIVACE